MVPLIKKFERVFGTWFEQLWSIIEVNKTRKSFSFADGQTRRPSFNLSDIPVAQSNFGDEKSFVMLDNHPRLNLDQSHVAFSKVAFPVDSQAQDLRKPIP